MIIKKIANCKDKMGDAHYYIVILLSFLLTFKKWVPEVSGFLFLVWIFTFGFKKGILNNDFLRIKMLSIPALAFFCWLIIDAFFHFSVYELYHADKHLGIIFFSFIFFGSDKFYFDEKRLVNIIWAFILGCLVTNIWSLSKGIIIKEIYYISFPYSPTKWFSVQLILSIIFACYLLYTYKLKIIPKVALWLTIILSTTSIYLIASRNRVLSALAAVMIIVFAHVKFSKKNKKIIIISLTVISLTFLLHPRFFLIFTEGHYGWRNDYWKISFNTATENYKSTLVGHGAKRGVKKYNVQLGEYKSLLKAREGRSVCSHNDFLDIFLMHGIIGLILFLSIFVSSSIYAYKQKNFLFLSFITMATVQFIFGSYYFWFRSGKYLFFFFYFFMLLFSNSFVKRDNNHFTSN